MSVDVSGILSPLLTILAGLALVVLAAGLARRGARAARVSARLFADTDRPDTLAADHENAPSSEAEGRIALWLVRAGHRNPRAERTFLASILACTAIAITLVWVVVGTGLAGDLSRLVSGLPVVGAGLGTFVAVSPWIGGIAIAALPVSLVRRDRARRVEEIEQDLPLVLELLATLAEAGLGFDSAVAEVLSAQPAGRPLADELRLYLLEVSTGARRSESLSRLSRRVDVPSVSSFTSALIHGEDTGASIAGMLRPQASLVRKRRRERALALAEALPEKLVVPLLVGFLPGLLVWTLGPAFFQLFEMIDSAIG